jgi:hypothetical protein
LISKLRQRLKFTDCKRLCSYDHLYIVSRYLQGRPSRDQGKPVAFPGLASETRESTNTNSVHNGPLPNEKRHPQYVSCNSSPLPVSGISAVMR